MALESFYGGKQGISPVIKASFEYLTDQQKDDIYIDSAYGAAIENASESEKEAINAKTLSIQFSNPDYQDVWFSELAIIDATNKFNPNNGKIYRRTLSTTTEQNSDNYAGPHAEYIGQVVGPAGGIPKMNFTSINGVQGQINDPNNTIISFPSSQTDMDTNKEHPLVVKETAVNNQLVPGKIDDNNFNDTIKYTWVNILPPDGTNNTSYVYLGFKIPYPIFEFNVATVGYQATATISESNDSKPHPFYWKYNLQIPRGIRGIWQEIKIGQKEGWTNTLYESLNDFIYNTGNDTYNIASGATTVNLTNMNITKFWYLEVKVPKQSGDPDVYYFYLEPYKTLSTVNFNDTNGSITLNYDDSTSITPSYSYRYPKDARYNEQDGSIEINYVGQTPGWIPLVDTTTTPSKTLYINYIKDIYGNKEKNEFYVLYSSSKYRYPEKYNATPSEGINKITTTDEKIWVKNANNSSDQVENNLWWELLSPLTSIDSLRIGAQIERDDITNDTQTNIPLSSSYVLNALNTGDKKQVIDYTTMNGQLLHYFESYDTDTKSVGYLYYWDASASTPKWCFLSDLSGGISGGGSNIQIYEWNETTTAYKVDTDVTALGFIKEDISLTPSWNNWPTEWEIVIPNA